MTNLAGSIVGVLGMVVSAPLLAATVKALPDLEYAEVDGKKLLLDLYLPEGVQNPPLVVNIHGGGWRMGNRKMETPLMQYLAEQGFAVASVQYRLSNVAKFPAQIQDCKGAVRWLRAHASDYGYDPDRIAAMGQSAGGYLALLLGMSDNVDLEGDTGGNKGVSSKVSAIVDFYGPTDFVLRSKDQPDQTEKEDGRVYQLLGGPVTGNEEKAKVASPAWQASADDPPILIIHGTVDRKVLVSQHERLMEACKAAGVPVELHVVEGGGHGDDDPAHPKFATKEVWDVVVKFLRAKLG